MFKINKWFIVFFSSLLVLSCSSNKNVSGVVLKKNAHASYYADKFNGRKTASGEQFSNSKLTAAHRKLAFGTKLKITNVVNKKWVVVTVNDRGPFIKSRDIDLSKEAFMQITDNKNHGTITVTIEIIK